MSTPTIYPSVDAANEAMPLCRRPLSDSGGHHWWYIDNEELEKQMDAKADTGHVDFVPCICKTCNQKMLLSADADEFPV